MCKKEKESLRINKNGDVLYYGIDEGFKYVLDKIPGGIFLKTLFYGKSELNNKRVLEFCTKFKEEIAKLLGRELHANDFNSENLLDVFDIAIQKVKHTSSEFKREKLKDIVVRQFLKPDLNNELVIKYIQLIDELSEMQILLMVKSSESRYPMTIPVFIDSIKSKEDSIEECLRLYNPSDIEFYLNDLISKGLIIEWEVDGGKTPEVAQGLVGAYGKVRIKYLKFSNSDLIYIPSDVGNKFLEYITNPS